MNPDTIGCAWTGEFDLNTLRVDGDFFESGKKNLRIQKYPDTCGRGLMLVLMLMLVLIAQVGTRLYRSNACKIGIQLKKPSPLMRAIIHPESTRK